MPNAHRILGSSLGALALALALLALGACGSSRGGLNGDGGPNGGGNGDGGGPGNGGNGPDGSVCASVTANLNRVTPTMALLVDQSGSMTTAFGNTDRWNAVRDTLMNNPNGVVFPLQHEIRFGLDLYSSRNGFPNDAGVCPIITKVAPALDNYTAINTVYAPANPIEDTPTGESVASVTADLMLVTAVGPKYIVLCTDGLPDTCAVPDPDGLQAAKDLSVNAVTAAFNKGIKTFVIAVGDQATQPHFQDLANAGAGKPLDHSGGDAPYYQAQNPAAVTGAFNQIIGGIRTCTFTMNGHIDPADAGSGTVTLDGMNLVFGTDWTVHADGQTLEILGGRCQAILNGTAQNLTAQFPCGVFIP
jgi:hypothetical protein